jgi:hypothetical protein
MSKSRPWERCHPDGIPGRCLPGGIFRERCLPGGISLLSEGVTAASERRANSKVMDLCVTRPGLHARLFYILGSTRIM